MTDAPQTTPAVYDFAAIGKSLGREPEIYCHCRAGKAKPRECRCWRVRGDVK